VWTWRSFQNQLAATFIFLTAATLPLAGQNTPASEKLQAATERAMTGVSGTLVVLDVVSGKILAAHDLRLAAMALARPGSTVKPFVLRALLEARKVDPEQRLLCRRTLRIGGVKMDCTHPAAAANLNATEALAYSCNSYFAEVATRLTAEELVAELKQAGLDTPSGLAEQEATGVIEKPRTPEALQLEGLGDRGIVVTPLQLLEAYRRLALERRGGKLGNAQAVFEGLEESVGYGMAHAVNLNEMKIAGKTGTAAARERNWTHGFFVGYAPADAPEIAIVVYLAQGRGTDAAAVARKVLAEFVVGRQRP